jgi:tetratricopeptide (TPR) repeat protein
MKLSITSDLIMNHSLRSITGAMSWKSGWLQFEEPSAQGDVSQLLEEANQIVRSANTKGKVLELMDKYEKALKIEPKNQEALLGAAEYNALLAMGYASDRDEKKIYSSQSIKYCEQVMYLNPAFRDLVDKGEPVWEACRALSVNELDALFCYYSAAGTCWKDCLNGFEKLINIKWTARIKKVLAAMMAIDPEWHCGTPYYSWANFYTSAPHFAGGNMNKASEYYKKAIELGPEHLNFRRSRALLFHLKNKDKKSFLEDLKWVVSQDPAKETKYLGYPWKVFIQRECQEALDHIKDYY